MVSEKNTVSATKPKSMWTKKIKIDLKPLFLAVGKAVAHTATLKFDELGVDAAEAATSIGVETTKNELAFLLVQRSLFNALVSLTKESISHVAKDLTCFESLSSDIEASLEGLEISFDKDFFLNPGKLSILIEIQSAYSQWLCDAGVAPRKAELISQRLRSYFIFAIGNEWRTNSPTYQPLLDSASSPFAGAEEYERGWQAYFAALDRRIAENVFDEAFSLEQIYVPLNAYYIERSKDKLRAMSVNSFSLRSIKVVVSLENELRRWLKDGDPADAMRVISGGPGSGKSSFTKILCSKLARDGTVKPIYIPLHLIDPTREVVSEVDRFVRDEGLLSFSPLDAEKKETKLLLVFDGLDELASQGKVAAQVTRDFVQAVERMVERRNLGPCPLFVLMSGREVVIQENETEFRKPHQILSLLPYFIPSNEQSGFLDEEKLLDVDLRNDWWKKYGELSGRNYSVLPDQLKSSEIDEITSQPLLNYLVALSFTRGKLDFSGDLNLNSVYADLVAAVHERGYEKSRTFRPIRHITVDEFLRVLEEIGLAAWHGSDGRSTSVKDIMGHCRRSGLETLLNTFKEGAEAGVTKLLAAFFFRRNGEGAGDDAAFVFTHKSFGEYLTSIRLTRGIERIAKERKRRANDPDEGFDVADALLQWARLTGPAPMSTYIQNFLNREIARRDKGQVAEWHQSLCELVESVIDHHLPVEKLDANSFAKMHMHDFNSSNALIIALNACARAIKKPSKVKFTSESSFGTFLRRACPQRVGPVNPPLYSALSYFDLSDQCLDMADFYGANLAYTKWSNAKLHFVNFSTSSIVEADFSSSRLAWSRFESNHIQAANFANSHLNEVNFKETTLLFCDFVFAKMEDSDFSGAILKDCNFRGATFRGTNIFQCREIESSDFEGAKIYADDIEFIDWFESQKGDGRVTGNLVVEPNPEHSREYDN